MSEVRDVLERLRAACHGATIDGPQDDAALYHATAEEIAALRADRDEARDLYQETEERLSKAHTQMLAAEAERDALREALTRLASCEAFGFARSTNDEDRARIDYARAALDRAKP